MAQIPSSSARLRTKTGCFPCRQRRKKCNEQKPRCPRCIRANVPCRWPVEQELYDTRHRSRKGNSPPKTTGALSVDPVCCPQRRPFYPEPILSSRALEKTLFRSDVEAVLYQHFFYALYPHLILSSAHPGFHTGYVLEFVDKVFFFDGLRHVVFACAASHMYLVSEKTQLHELSLTYYSRAVSDVNRALDGIDSIGDKSCDALLTAIIFLYIHGLWGSATISDAPQHVHGAIQLLKLRYAKSSPPSSTLRAFERIATESVLYHVFRLAAWHPCSFNIAVDAEFWLQAEKSLQVLTYPDASLAANSPVLGIPLSLHKIILSIVQFCRDPCKDAQRLTQLKSEMKYWESMVIEDKALTSSTGAGDLCRHATMMYILSASLMLEWVPRSLDVKVFQPRNIRRSSNQWQVRKAMDILRCPSTREQWTNCYLGCWPTLIFGYAVDTKEDVALIRKDLEERWNCLQFTEVSLVMNELESVWTERNIG